jgi:Na+-driven multidrug efflux pump
MGVIIVIWPQWVFGIFTKDPEVLDMALTYIPVMMVLLLGSALRPPLSALINGSGNFKLNLVVGVLDGVLLRIGLSVLFGITCGFGVYGFWYGHALAGLTPFFVGIVYFFTGRWRTRKYIIKN